jgi:hypothetical protein
MFTELERPLTDAEKKRLLASLPRTRSFVREWGLAYLIHIVGMPVLWLFIAWWHSKLEASVFVGLYGVAYFLFLAVVSWSDLRSARFAAHRRADLERQLSTAPVVSVQRVEAEKVVEILCDEVNLYLYDLEDGRFFVADAWDASRGRRPRKGWPNSCFELIKVPGADEEFGPFCFGKKLVPIEYLDFREVDLDKLAGESRIYEGSLDALRFVKAENGSANPWLQ